MVDLLTDFVFLSNDSKDNVRLCAVEAPPTIFSQEHEDDNSSYQQILDVLALPWTEGNYVDLGIVTENHCAYKLIKQEQKQKMIAMGRKELREFLNISNATVKPFRAQIRGECDPLTKLRTIFSYRVLYNVLYNDSLYFPKYLGATEIKKLYEDRSTESTRPITSMVGKISIYNYMWITENVLPIITNLTAPSPAV